MFGLKSFNKGFVLPFTMLVSTLILFITLGTMTLLSKQLRFARQDKKSRIAFLVADNAIACAIDVDARYVSSDGLGIYPYSSTTNSVTSLGGSPVYGYITTVLAYTNTKRKIANPLATDITLPDIKCNQSLIFDTSPASDSKFTVLPDDYKYRYINPISGLAEIEYGLTSTFNMRMPAGDGTFRCAKITVNKTESFRQIISQGYSECNNPTGAVERAVVDTTVVN